MSPRTGERAAPPHHVGGVDQHEAAEGPGHGLERQVIDGDADAQDAEEDQKEEVQGHQQDHLDGGVEGDLLFQVAVVADQRFHPSPPRTAKPGQAGQHRDAHGERRDDPGRRRVADGDITETHQCVYRDGIGFPPAAHGGRGDGVGLAGERPVGEPAGHGDDEGDFHPVHVVGQGNPQVGAALVPDPGMGPVHHEGVQGEIPGRQDQRGEQGKQEDPDGTSPCAQGLAFGDAIDQAVARIHHGEPAQGHHQGNAPQAGTEHGGVVVRGGEACADAQEFQCERQTAGDAEEGQDPLPAHEAGAVDQRGQPEQDIPEDEPGVCSRSGPGGCPGEQGAQPEHPEDGVGQVWVCAFRHEWFLDDGLDRQGAQIAKPHRMESWDNKLCIDYEHTPPPGQWSGGWTGPYGSG